MVARFLVLLLAVTALSAQVVPGRYLVEFSGEPGVRRSREAVRRDQDQARVWLRLGGAVERLSVESIANAIAVETDEAGAERLRRIPGVKRVQPVVEYRMTLNHALPLLGAPAAWELAGPNPGAGVKIAIIDSGIDITHPGFDDPSMTAPDGYPQVGDEQDRVFTNGKVIVARSYAALLPRRDPDLTARDRVGHGTAAAMVAAGVIHDGPFGRISGVAPKAWLGSYKVFGSNGINDGTTSDVVLKAIDDAVTDGMNVINLSLGSSPAPLPEADIERDAIERATERGVLVVASSGNEGPDLTTVSSPATAPSALAVGATRNDRRFATKLEVEGSGAVAAVPGSGANPPAVVEAALRDIRPFDDSALGCSPLPAGSLTGRMALILRGTCNFSVKIANARQAGAVAAVIYASEERPDLVTMDAAGETLPASMISREDGIVLRDFLAGQPDASARLHFKLGELNQDAQRLAGFTGKGPGPDLAVKPELVTTGTDLLTATQRLAPEGSLYAESGYVVVSGTSFSAPLTAGAAAVLRAARPGLTAAQYRSLLIDQTDSLPFPMQAAGAGRLRLDNSMRAAIAVEPAILALGAGGRSMQREVSASVTNLGAGAAEFDVTVEARREGLTVTAPATVTAGAGEKVSVPVTIAGADLQTGAHEGFVVFKNRATEQLTRVPYWYAVTSEDASTVAVLEAPSTGRPGAILRDAILFRFLDAGGVPIENVTPELIVVSGDGEILRMSRFGSVYPGLLALTVRLGAGTNVFRVKHGEVFRDFTVSGQ